MCVKESKTQGRNYVVWKDRALGMHQWNMSSGGIMTMILSKSGSHCYDYDDTGMIGMISVSFPQYDRYYTGSDDRKGEQGG
jgi:hypothetical protein